MYGSAEIRKGFHRALDAAIDAADDTVKKAQDGFACNIERGNITLSYNRRAQMISSRQTVRLTISRTIDLPVES